MKSREPQLDALRCYAFLMVFAVHAFPSFGVGRFGVDLFFVLSGFLITGLLMRERANTGTIDLAAFYTRRLARIAPAYFLVLAFVAPVLSWRHLAGFSLFAGNLTMIGSSPPLATAHLWSLCVEMQFYLVWPILLSRFRVLPLALLMLAGPLVARLLIALLDIPHDAVWFFTPTRLDAFAVGALIALRPVTLSPGFILIGIAGLFGAEWLLTSPGWPLAYSLAALSAGVILCAARSLPAPGPCVKVGVVSYGAYLLHLPLLELTGNPVAAMALTLAIAALSCHYIEDPAATWITRTAQGLSAWRAGHSQAPSWSQRPLPPPLASV